MKNHTKIYLNAFGYSTADFIPCEICANKAVDIHHIEARGMGGDPTGSKDVIENLIALCRECHNAYGDVPDLKDLLKSIHEKQMVLAGINLKN